MKRLRSLATLALGLIIVLAADPTPARADFLATLTASVTQQTGGLYLYTYTVTDLANSTSAISEIDLSLTNNPSVGIITAAGAPITSITMPGGFTNTYTLGDPTISFYSTDPANDITASNSATFSFTSTFGPAFEPYQLSSFGGTGSLLTGLVVTPAIVPEPSSLILSSLGALASLGWIARGRSRKVNVAA